MDKELKQQRIAQRNKEIADKEQEIKEGKDIRFFLPESVRGKISLLKRFF
jgi:hypothetical protein